MMQGWAYDPRWHLGGAGVDLTGGLATFRRSYPYREIALDGVVWRYRVGGVRNAPSVLLLPGGTLVPDPFFVVIEELGRRYQVIAAAYPPARSMAELVGGTTAILDAERLPAVHVFGSSFGGYLAQCLVRAHPERVSTLILAQTGVRHFVGPAPITVLQWLLQAAPALVVRWFMWRTWRVLIADIGADQPFWMGLLHNILETELSKAHLVAVMAAIADFTAHHRPTPGDLSAWAGPVLLLQSEHDRAFAAQAAEIRAVYPHATVRILRGAGHGALFTHTDQYVNELQSFLAAHATAGQLASGPRGGGTTPLDTRRPVRDGGAAILDSQPKGTATPNAAPGHAPAGLATFDLSVAIRCPSSAVFALLADIQNAEPIPRRAAVRMIKEPVGPTMVGTCWHEHVRLVPGFWMHVESVVSDLEQPRLLGMDFWSPWFIGHLTYRIEPTADGSVLRQQETLRPHALLRWLTPVIERRLRPRLVQRLDDIKVLLEAAP